MVSVQTAPALVVYSDILDACRIEHDNDADAPWENCDGFEHTAEPARQFDHDIDDMQGAVWCNGRRERVVIQLPRGEDYGIFDCMRARGASRQVAAEAVAAARRRTLAQLVEWYGNGWQYFGVVCELEICGREYFASCWGIDDEDYARKSVAHEIADEIACELEKDGFTVVGKPDEVWLGTRDSQLTRDAWRAEYARNMAAQNWRA